jgi:crotonobetainyl-CoA:carnitine CoA-transferase CaiB-like acyl-CoA transferase
VLDLTRLLPGALCTMLLADMGADVIKVEEPGRGDYMRWNPPLRDGQSVLFNALNRNKRSVTLNLKADAARVVFLRLVSTAAVVIEGNRPGVMERLGLGWPVLSAANPKLVMCSLTGYGQSGPLAQHAGHDLNYMSIAGATSMNRGRDGQPHPLAVQVADLGGGAQSAATAILGALLGVERGGGGQYLDVSMTDGVLSWLAVPLAQTLEEGPIAGDDHRLTGRYSCYRVYRCADGRYLSVGALEPKFWAALCEALERPDLVERQYAVGEEQMRLHEEMEGIFARSGRDEWAQRLSPLETCCEPVLELDEVARHPQVVARGLLVERETGLEVGPAVAMGGGWRRLDPPRLGEHTAEVLGEVGVETAALEEMRVSGAV